MSIETISTHEAICPYINRAERVKLLGGGAVDSTRLDDLIEQVHVGDQCPPTHESKQPTTTWSDFVRDTSD